MQPVAGGGGGGQQGRLLQLIGRAEQLVPVVRPFAEILFQRQQQVARDRCVAELQQAAGRGQCQRPILERILGDFAEDGIGHRRPVQPQLRAAFQIITVSGERVAHPRVLAQLQSQFAQVLPALVLLQQSGAPKPDVLRVPKLRRALIQKLPRFCAQSQRHLELRQPQRFRRRGRRPGKRAEAVWGTAMRPNAPNTCAARDR